MRTAAEATHPTRVIRLPVLVALTCCLSAAAQNSPMDSTRPTVSSGASIQPQGVLQIESGYDGFFAAPPGQDQTAATGFYYAATPWLRLDAAVSEWRLTDFDTQNRAEGTGNVSVGTRAVLRRAAKRRTGYAVEYEDTLPVGSRHALRDLGQTVTAITSRKLRDLSLKLNASLLQHGCDSGNSCHYGGQIAAGASWERWRATTVYFEVFGQNASSSNAPPGSFAFAGVGHHLSPRVELNGGIRAGLTPSSSRIGVSFGATFAIGGRARSVSASAD